MSESYVYRGQAESDILFTSSGNSIYEGYGIGGRQVATVSGNSVYLGIGTATTPLAEFDGDTIRCPYSRTQLGLIRNGQFYDGYGGGSPLLTLQNGGDVMTLVAAAALTIDDGDLYDIESGRRYSNANEHGAGSHRDMVHAYNDSRYSSRDKELVSSGCDGDGSVISVAVDSSPSSYHGSGQGGYRSVSIPKRYMIDEDGNRVVLNMPGERADIISDFLFEGNYRRVDIRIRRLWSDEDVENFKKIAVKEGNYDSSEDYANAKYIRRMKSEIEDDLSRSKERGLEGMKTQRIIGADSFFGYVGFSLSALFYSITFISGDPIRAFSFLFAFCAGIFGLFFYDPFFFSERKRMQESYYRLYRNHKLQVKFCVINFLSFFFSFATGNMFFATVCMAMAIISLLRIVYSSLFDFSLKNRKRFEHYKEMYEDSINGSSYNAIRMKGDLEKLKNIIGKEKYDRLAGSS